MIRMTVSEASATSEDPKYPASTESNASPSQCSTTGREARESTAAYTRS